MERPALPRRRRAPAVLVALLAAALVPACDGTAGSTAPAGPDVVVFMADDLGWADVGFHGSPILTRYVDGLAAEGVELTRLYTAPSDRAARASFLTGRAPEELGLATFESGSGRAPALPTEVTTLAERFRDAGYFTALIGKWGLGDEPRDAGPLDHGFDHFYGNLGQGVDYFTHQRGEVTDWQRNGVTVDEKGYATDLVARESIELIEGLDAATPLFLWVSFQAPHAPLQAPYSTVQHYHASVSDPHRRTYAAMVHYLDLSVGVVLEALERTGRADDTVVLFLSDNGGAVAHAARNVPLRGGKFTCFEGGIRVPAVVWYPAGLEGGRTFDGVASAADLLPTLVAAAGLRPGGGELAGVELWSALRGEAEPPARRLFFAATTPKARQLAVLDPPWKLVEVTDGEGGEPRALLYDVFADPGETENRAAVEPERARALAAELDGWREAHRP